MPGKEMCPFFFEAPRGHVPRWNCEYPDRYQQIGEARTIKGGTVPIADKRCPLVPEYSTPSCERVKELSPDHPANQKRGEELIGLKGEIIKA